MEFDCVGVVDDCCCSYSVIFGECEGDGVGCFGCGLALAWYRAGDPGVAGVFVSKFFCRQLTGKTGNLDDSSQNKLNINKFELSQKSREFKTTENKYLK